MNTFAFASRTFRSIAVSVFLVFGAIIFASGCSVGNTDGSGSDTTDVQRSASQPIPTLRRRDFDWKSVRESRHYRRQIMAMANDLTAHDPRCAAVDPKSLAPAKAFSKRAPRYTIACRDKQGRLERVELDVADMNRNEEAVAARTPLGEDDAAFGCERIAKSASNHPYSLDFSRVYGATYMPDDDGKVHFTTTFTAENSFGVRDEYRIHCYFQGGRLVRFNVGKV